MSTLEAAASLFGSDGDSGPDPFAVIGNEATDTAPPHDEHEPAHTSSHPFQMGQDSSSWFTEQMYPDAQQEQHGSWFIPTAQDALSGQSHRSGLPFSYDLNQGSYSEAPQSAYAAPPGQRLVPLFHLVGSFHRYSNLDILPEHSYLS